MADEGILIVISGPSGSGKSTVVSKLLKNPRYAFSVSATTRAPRVGEEHGRHYFFISKEDFRKKIDDGQMLEYAQYVGNFYGTPREPVMNKLSSGHHVVLEIETNGALQVKKAFPEAVMIMILPPSMQTLEARLRGRRTNTEEDIAKRLAAAEREIQIAPQYDYLVINDTVENAVDQIETIIRAESNRVRRNKDFIGSYLDSGIKDISEN